MSWVERPGSAGEGLVAYNQRASPAVPERFRPDNLATEPVQAYAVDEKGLPRKEM